MKNGEGMNVDGWIVDAKILVYLCRLERLMKGYFYNRMLGAFGQEWLGSPGF